MKLSNILFEVDLCFISEKSQTFLNTILEGFKIEIDDLTDAYVHKPYAQFKSKQIHDLSNKLLNWANTTLIELENKPRRYKNSKRIEGILNKIIKNPRDAAFQIFSILMSRETKEDVRKINGGVILSGF